MYIKSYRTDKFAGIDNRTYEFEEGTNLLLGPNEAGKSTIIDGIYHTLFTPAKLRKNQRSDKDFIAKYFNDKSDTINGQVEFIIDGDLYKIEKTWSKTDKYSQRLSLADGSIISSEDTIRKKIEELFQFGTATYKYLNFSSHGDKNEPLYNISSDESIRGDISNYLNKTVMELDGISLEKLEKNIDQRLKDLGSNWDFDKNAPNNSRGIENPYQKNVGTILANYYEKEYLKRDLRDGVEKEKELEEAAALLGQIEGQYEETKLEKQSMDSISEDIRKRYNLERDLKDLEDKSAKLRQAAKDLPSFEAEYKSKSKELDKKRKDKESIEGKLAYVDKAKRRKDLQDLIGKYKAKNEEKNKISQGLESFDNISSHDLERLRELSKDRSILEAQLSGGNIEVDLKVYDKDLDIILIDGMENRIDKSGSGSYFHLYSQDKFEFKVKLGDLDYEVTRKKIDEYKDSYREILHKAGAEDLGHYEEKLREKNDLNMKLLGLESDISHLLDRADIHKLEEELESLSSYTETYDQEDLESNLESVNEEISQMQNTYIEAKLKYQSLVDQYQSIDNIFDMVGQVSIEKARIGKDLESLAGLPDEFQSTDDFFEKKDRIDKSFQSLNDQYYEAREAHSQAQANLGETTVQDLSFQLKEKEEEFDRNIKVYGDLLYIKEVYNTCLEEVRSRPSQGLEESLSKYLGQITDSSIGIGPLEDRLSLRGRGDNELRYYHLSKGSKDSVALALRLALVENIFEGGTFIAFDDILTDLDRQRKQEAIKLLKEFSKENQIIFASFDKDLASELGGNIIEVGK